MLTKAITCIMDQPQKPKRSPFNNNLFNRTAFAFVILLGSVSLFADMTYEGARSITGQYLSLLGASAFVVALVSGFGEMIGYAIRLISGYISDKTRRYWTITILGYAINLAAVPLLAFAQHWTLAVILIVLERCGKAIRTPARDAMLSYATHEMGRGWGFGIHMAMDQVGAVLGPLFVTAVLFATGSYPYSFLLLGIPAIVSIALLIGAQQLYPSPQSLEVSVPHLETKGLTRTYWLYVVATSLVAIGYVDFPLIAFHFLKDDIPQLIIPLYYATAMSVSALSALIAGRLYDRIGMPVLIGTIVLAALFPPLVFFGNKYVALLGVVFWGLGMGTQGSILRAVVANLVGINKRGTAYGILNSSFGICWFIGSAIIGLLYQTSIPALVIFSVVAQLASIPILLRIEKL